jgi:hypothetical protein
MGNQLPDYQILPVLWDHIDGAAYYNYGRGPAMGGLVLGEVT